MPDAQQTRTIRLKDRALVGIDFVLLARRQKLLEGFVDAHDLEGDAVLSIAAVWNGGERRACHPAKLELLVVRLGRAQRDERDFLAPYVERGVPIVGLEPSCLLTLRDEFAALLPGERTGKLAQNGP